MTVASSISLFIALIILAVIPGPGILAVVARSLAGFKHGLITVIGIVAGDFVFIFLTVYGLSFLAQAMSPVFLVIKYLGAAYLIWLGVSFWRNNTKLGKVEAANESILKNFLTGFLTTLGNPKALMFYAGFFPAFLDLKTLTHIDVIWILAITAVSVGGVMIAYAALATVSRKKLSNASSFALLNKLAGGALIGTGATVALRQ